MPNTKTKATSPVSAAILDALRRNGPGTLNEIAARVAYSQRRTSEGIGALRDAGLIEVAGQAPGQGAPRIWAAVWHEEAGR